MLAILENCDWKFWIGDVIIPVLTFIAGCFFGGGVERRRYKAKAKVKGSGNTVIVNSNNK